MENYFLRGRAVARCWASMVEQLWERGDGDHAVSAIGYKPRPATTVRWDRDGQCPQEFWGHCPRQLDFRFGLAEALFERANCKVRLRLVNEQRRRKADGVFAGAEHQ